MNETLVRWLEAREIADTRSRSRELAKAFAMVVKPTDQVIDLGCGTMANFRYLDPFLSMNQNWIGVDQDSGMLRRSEALVPRTRVQLWEMDLAFGIGSLPHGQGYAFTASAFLDLVSLEWINRFADHCKESPILIAMSSVGQPEWSPNHALDEPIRKKVELHQTSDHGFGLSLGANAASYLADRLSDYGCQVNLQETHWELDSRDHALLSMMIDGIERRVGTMHDPIDAQSWAIQRRDQLYHGELRLVVRHIDLLSLP
jgi:trans-aconitate methyltransferase